MLKCIEIITADEDDLSELVLRVDDEQARIFVNAGLAKFVPKHRYKQQMAALRGGALGHELK